MTTIKLQDWNRPPAGTTLEFHLLSHMVGLPSGSVVKNLPPKQEMQVLSLGWEDPLQMEVAANSSIFAWEIPQTEEPGRLQHMGSQRVTNDVRAKYQQEQLHG